MIGWLFSSSLLLLSSAGQQGLPAHGTSVPPCLDGRVNADAVPLREDCATEPSAQDKSKHAGFQLRGLQSPAQVEGSIFVDAPGLPWHASVTYFFDDQPFTTTREFPFKLGRDDGYLLDAIRPGIHHLRAEASLPNGETLSSDAVTLDLVASLNQRFSPSLDAYANQPTAQVRSLEEMLQRTSTEGVKLREEEIAVRKNALAMYINWGIDPSLDSKHDQSEVMLSLSPQGWASSIHHGNKEPLSLRFSPDAPFYQEIPHQWPRVLLPSGYFQHVQVNTVQAGDGIGFGQSVADPNDSEQPIHSQWYGNITTSKTFTFRMSPRWAERMPWQPGGDHHMIFVDPVTETFVSSYMTSHNESTGGADALYASSPTKLETLGDKGGSIAAGFAELPTMLQPGEATNARQPIRHALGGAVARTWAARVYPASARDANVLTSVNSCTGTGFTNTGLVPYGGVIQLDPEVDLKTLGLTLPALRILEAIQTYGYYVEDFGCSDFDLYTAISESELDPYGGLWGYNRKGVGVQNEVERVLVNSKLYVVAPLVKKQ